MNTRKKNILVWSIIWAGLLLIVLYSPIGSPDLYTPKNYFTDNQGVRFSGTSIPNYSPSIKSGYQSAYQDINAPAYEMPELKDNASYPVTVSENSNGSKAGSMNINNPQQITGKQNGNTAEGIAVNLSSMPGKSAKQNSPSPKTGFMALTTDMSTHNTTRQGADYSLDSGGADPGGNPTGDPVPVGDGWWLLILFAVCYIVIKKR